ncbi:MAG: hypothetical protein KDI09_08530, partial [Halioglobus sp.]|nr:hypothetical protein [Halioglobus sp.]
VPNTLEFGERNTVVLDCMSQLRMLAIAQGRCASEKITADQARTFLSQVLALNLRLVVGHADESMRTRLGKLGGGVSALYQYLLAQLGYDCILSQLVEEIWRILAQRPIQVAGVKNMIAQMASVLANTGSSVGGARLGADRLVCALFSPTQGCIDDPGIEIYQARLASMDTSALQQEAYGFARSMHDVGLVADYHAIFVRWLLANDRASLLPSALGLSSTGNDILASYQHLVHALVEEAIFVETAQSLYGLTLLLENGTLHLMPIGPGLWRQIKLQLSSETDNQLQRIFGHAQAPRVHLLAGVISLLGQPLGISQGNNPTCQSARALSMWAYNDPDYLLHIIAQAARNDGVVMHFEGQPIDSSALAPASIVQVLDTDPVSVLLVPHLDRIYHEMGRLCAGRGEDPHKWINPELHGWWVGRDFFIAVDIYTGLLHNYDAFLRQFIRGFHPYYNGNQPVIHPQPVGLAVTDSNAGFVGWHAVTLLRVALDQEKVMRVYFFNPNGDGAQNWGNGVTVSIQGSGERFGECSLPFEQFLSRLYLFHDDAIDLVETSGDFNEVVEASRSMGLASWAAGKAGEALSQAES